MLLNTIGMNLFSQNIMGFGSPKTVGKINIKIETRNKGENSQVLPLYLYL
jgi:hypothetical protein